MEELTETVLLIVGERIAVHEPAIPVHCECGFKGRSTARFKAQLPEAPRSRCRDDAFEDHHGGAHAKKRRMGPHGFDLAGEVIERFQRSDAGD